MAKQNRAKMYLLVCIVYVIILSSECVSYGGIDGDLMYRISQRQLNELAPIMYENPRAYYVHGFVDICESDTQIIVTRPSFKEPEKDISVVLLNRTYVKVTITYKRDLSIQSQYAIYRRSDGIKANISEECQVKNAVFSVIASVGVYKTLRFKQEALNGTVTVPETLKTFLNEGCVRRLLSKMVFEMVRHKIDSIFQITYEYPDTQTDFGFLKELDTHCSMYTIAQQVELPEFWDIKAFVLWQNNTIPSLPPSIRLPVNLPEVEDAERFEIWLSEKGLHKLWGDLAQSFMKHIGDKLQNVVEKYAENKFGHNKPKAEDIFFIPKIAKIYPNSDIDVIPTKLTMWTKVNKTSASLFVSLSFDITATMISKEKNTTFNAFSIDMNMQFPTQFGVNNFKLNANFLNLGGTITIRDSTIGVIKNDFFSNQLYFFPHMYGEKIMKKYWGDNNSGTEVYKMVRDEFGFRNLSIRLEEGYVVLEADVVPSTMHVETEGEFVWVGHYRKEDWVIWLHDTTPINDASQHTTPTAKRHSSGGMADRAFSLHWILLGIFIGAVALQE